jgi:hypothetical protein
MILGVGAHHRRVSGWMLLMKRGRCCVPAADRLEDAATCRAVPVA